MAVEARIVNCKLKTNNNLGCASEEWFSKYKGQELLDFVRSQKTKVIDKVIEVLESDKRPEAKKAPITVILNAYHRPYNLKMQIDAIRKQNRPEPEQLYPDQDYEPDQEAVVELQQETERLTSALGELPEKQRVLVEKAYLGELSHSEIAEITGLPLGTIKSRIRLALEKLRHAMM